MLRGPLILGLLILATLVACEVGAPFSGLRPTATPSPTLAPTYTPWPTATPLPPDTGWQVLHPGVEVRSLDVPTGQDVERVTVARLDPEQVRLRVLYTPGVAFPVSAWAQQTDALLVVNGGYFTDAHTVTGLTISNRHAYGTPYEDYAGMLAVTEEEAVSVRWLRTWPYDPTEPLREGIQSFPVLVKPGGVMGFPADADDGRISRRTVVAQDRQGRLLLLLAPRGLFSLHACAVWLTESDLDLEIALNLDGGTSSGFWMASGPQIDSMVPVPAVIAVLPR